MKPEKTEGRVSDPTRGCGLRARDLVHEPVLIARASPLSQLHLLFASAVVAGFRRLEVVPGG
jgi:hypothetical protein